MGTKHVIAIVGPTAIGKTSLSIALANDLGCEILSADSRQFYREMSIGTAAPSTTELSMAPHHFIHHKSIYEPYSVGDFERDAIAQLEKNFQSSQTAILVGGSGLYVDAVSKGLDHFPKIESKIRESLNQRLQNEGLVTLQEELRSLDQKAFKHIAIDNPHRVIRALEVCIGTGQPYTNFLNDTKAERPFKTIYIGLNAPREIIYERINRRVDLMMEAGLLDEVRSLMHAKDLNALNTVGYKELFRFLEGQCNLDDAVLEIKKNTRRFAKRQLTWYRKNEDIRWFDYDTPFPLIINALYKILDDEN